MDTLKITSQKAYPRQSSGKFITIYPRNIEEFKFIISKLYESLKDFNGPYILSDKRYLECKVVYYRYGGFFPNYRYDTEGNAIPTIIDGHGNNIDDNRLPYFLLPDGIDNIYSDNMDDNSSILAEEYEIINALRFTNAGGVYLAKKKSDDQFVIIKEARPYTQLIYKNIDAVFVRKEELKRLKELQHTGFVPNVIDAFYDWEHFFIIEEYVEGNTLDEFVVVNDPLLD